MSDWLEAYCPMGCGKTLFVGQGGYITCSYLGCPDPTKVADLLLDPEHEHIVVIEASTFSIKHPLRERPDELLACSLHDYMSGLVGPPAALGRYRVRSVDGRWSSWERLLDITESVDGPNYPQGGE